MTKTLANTIVKVRVDKTQMRTFPFDVVYLVPVEHKALLPRLFPWSLCVPMHDTLRAKLRDLSIAEWEDLPHKTDRATTHTPMQSRSLYALLGETIDKDTYFVVVPVLPLTTPHKYCKSWKRRQPPRSRIPTYLMAPHHAQEEKPKLEGILMDDTVLFTPSGPRRPVCLLCPRHLLHMQNKCQLGSHDCYNELILKRSPDVQLQDDDADDDSSSLTD